MANVGTSTVAYATQQPTGSLVFIASDGTACVLWNDGTNQKFSYASSPYSSWTTTTLVTGLNMALGGKFRSGTDNIDVVSGGSANVRGNYFPLTKIGATYSLGTSNVITGTTAIGSSAVGNVMSYAGQDPQGRHWIVVGGASTYTAETGYFSPANSPTSTGWTASPSSAVAQTGDVNLPAGDQIGNFILRIWWNGTALQYSRADNSAASVGAWATAATIPNLTGSPNASSRVVFKAISSTQALLAYSTGSGIYAQTYTPGTNTWSAATQLSTNASDRHPQIATDQAGNAWVVWCSFVATNNYALVYSRWNGNVWDNSPITLVSAGTNIANPNAGYGNQTIGVTYTQGTANPFTVGWVTFSSLRIRQVPTQAALSGTTWYGGGWRYKKQVTIDHTKVSGGADLTNFPVLVSLTDVDLKTVGNGGKVQNAAGFDLIFLDSSQTTQLDHEIEKYDGVAGTITMWVRIPTLSASVDTIISCYFGNSGITTTQENKTGVWDAFYKGVYHLGDGTTLSVTDSTANAYHATNTGATAAAGQIDGGANFSGGAVFLTLPAGLSTNGATALTLECRVKLNNNTFTGYPGLMANDRTDTSHNGFFWFLAPTADGKSGYIDVGNGVANTATGFGTGVLSTANFTGLAATWISGGTLVIYVNGASSASVAALTGAIGAAAGAISIARYSDGSNNLPAILDELRISIGIARSAGWITTSDSNQSAPGSFLTAGATTTLVVSSSRTMPTTAALFTQNKTRSMSASAVLWTTPLPIYWGAYEPPFYPDASGITTIETLVGKALSIVSGYNQWAWAGNTPATLFDTTWANTVRNHGSLPLLTWQPTDGGGVTNASYTLASIYNGSHDTYITQFAQDVAAWGHPLFLRFAHEMNGNWYPWCEGVNGNVAGDYVLAWKHVHDIFVAQGASNVTWVWCPNQVETAAFSGMYPGDAYVDWVGVDSYNLGGLTFSQIFTGSYSALVALAPTKPIMIAETGTVEEAAGVKASWYTDMLTVQLPGSSFNKIRAVVLFNAAYGTNTTIPIDSTTASKNAFSAGINSGYFVGPVLSSVTITPISPYGITVSTRTIPASAALLKTASRSVGVTAALLSTRTRTVIASGALLATSTRTITASAALLKTASRSVAASSALLQTATRTITASAALTFTFSRTMNASGALLATSTRTAPVTGALLATSTRTIGASVAVQSQSNRSVPVSAALSITRAVPTSGALSLTSARTLGTSTALLLTQARQIGTSTALLATTARTVPATSALIRQASRSIPATGALSISRVVPATTPLSLTSSRTMPVSVALLATSPRTLGSSVALLGTFSRTVPSSAALLASLSRSIGASATLLSTRTRTVTDDAALSLTGTATRTIPVTGALLATTSRSIGTSAALGLSNVTRTIPTTTALLRQASRSIPASTPLQATASRQVTGAAALLSQASRSIPVNAALIATLTRSSGATVALIATSSRTLGTSVALSLPGVKFRDIPCSTTLSGGSRNVPTTVALRGTQTRSISSTASISIFFAGVQIGIPASVALQRTSARYVVCMVALLASNASLRFHSGVADIRVRSGTVNIIVS